MICRGQPKNNQMKFELLFLEHKTYKPKLCSQCISIIRLRELILRKIPANLLHIFVFGESDLNCTSSAHWWSLSLDTKK